MVSLNSIITRWVLSNFWLHVRYYNSYTEVEYIIVDILHLEGMLKLLWNFLLCRFMKSLQRPLSWSKSFQVIKDICLKHNYTNSIWFTETHLSYNVVNKLNKMKLFRLITHNNSIHTAFNAVNEIQHFVASYLLCVSLCTCKRGHW